MKIIMIGSQKVWLLNGATIQTVKDKLSWGALKGDDRPMYTSIHDTLIVEHGAALEGATTEPSFLIIDGTELQWHFEAAYLGYRGRGQRLPGGVIPFTEGDAQLVETGAAMAYREMVGGYGTIVFERWCYVN
jgi:hypothetical protein